MPNWTSISEACTISNHLVPVLCHCQVVLGSLQTRKWQIMQILEIP